MLECVVNVSEGRRDDTLDRLTAACGRDLLDVHVDVDHHRSVFTLAGVEAPRALAQLAVEELDVSDHDGVHPRLGVVDVVPFVPLDGATIDEAMLERDQFAAWLAGTHSVPCFVYGPERTLPDIRRSAFSTLAPDYGPVVPHPTAGACCVGARQVLVAYNVWLKTTDVAVARRVAADVRDPSLRALGLQVGSRVQVSMNLIAPDITGPAEAFDRVSARVQVVGAELVGLVPERVLQGIDPQRWPQLDLSIERTIERRMHHRSH